MNAPEYPEIEALVTFIDRSGLTIDLTEDDTPLSHWRKIQVYIGKRTFDLWVDDEYRDLEKRNPLLGCILALRELENIEDSTDFLDWCSTMGVNQPEVLVPLLDYYKSMLDILPAVRKWFKNEEIHSFVSDFDFELNAGAVQLLRSQNH